MWVVLHEIRLLIHALVNVVLGISGFMTFFRDPLRTASHSYRETNSIVWPLCNEDSAVHITYRVCSLLLMLTLTITNTNKAQLYKYVPCMSCTYFHSIQPRSRSFSPKLRAILPREKWKNSPRNRFRSFSPDHRAIVPRDKWSITSTEKENYKRYYERSTAKCCCKHW
jgi:hypothetical protein